MIRTIIIRTAGLAVLAALAGNAGAGELSADQIAALTTRIQNGGTEVVNAKAGGGSATLSMAHAGARFTESLLKGLAGEQNIVEYAYIESDVVPECKWFSTKVLLGKNGLEKDLGIGTLDAFETEKLKDAVKELLPSIKEGVDFAAAQ